MHLSQQRILILACGNPLRSDDGVGWRIAERLEDDTQVQVILTQQLLPEHSEPISTADVVIFLDCSVAMPPGTVSSAPVEAAASMPRIFTHHLDPSSMLRLTMDLFNRLPRHAFAIIVGGESFELSENLSRSVEASIPVALAAIRNLIAKVSS
jgi:hydrogenase maturation protease